MNKSTKAVIGIALGAFYGWRVWQTWQAIKLQREIEEAMAKLRQDAEKREKGGLFSLIPDSNVSWENVMPTEDKEEA